MSSNLRRLLILLALVVLAGGLILYNRVGSSSSGAGGEAQAGTSPFSGARDGQDGPGDGRTNHKPVTPTLEVYYLFDASDKDKLVGYSDAVFVGRVERQVGEKARKSTIPNDPGLPETQFSVSVGEIIKGDGTPRGVSSGKSVTVNQAGGKDPKTGKQIVVEAAGSTPHAGDAVVLTPGYTYLFATRYEESQSWQAISAQPYGNVPLDISSKEREKTIDDFRRAAEEQVNPLPGKASAAQKSAQ